MFPNPHPLVLVRMPGICVSHGRRIPQASLRTQHAWGFRCAERVQFLKHLDREQRLGISEQFDASVLALAIRTVPLDGALTVDWRQVGNSQCRAYFSIMVL